MLHVSLSRGKLNPWNHTMTLEMRHIFDTLASDPLVDVVVLSGEGRAFCAGLDVGSSQLAELASGGGSSSAPSTEADEEPAQPDPARIAFGLKQHIDEFQASLTSMEKCMKPVISAVHGIVFGLGVDLMCATDIRYADEESRFCIKVGLATVNDTSLSSVVLEGLTHQV